MTGTVQASSRIPIRPFEEIQAEQEKFREGRRGLVYCGSSVKELYLLSGSVDHIQRITFVYRDKRVEVVYCAWHHFIKEMEKDDILEFYEKSESPEINVLNWSPFWLVFKCGERSEKIPPYYLIAVNREDLINGCKVSFLEKKAIHQMNRTI